MIDIPKTGGSMTPESYAEAYEKKFDYVVNTLARKGISRQEAEEITQIAWAKGWEKLDQLKNAGHLIPWVVKIALNTYLQNLRKDKNIIFVDISFLDEKQQGINMHNLTSLEMEGYLKRVSPENRHILILRYCFGYTDKQISEMMGGISENGVKTRALRVIRFIQRRGL